MDSLIKKMLEKKYLITKYDFSEYCLDIEDFDRKSTNVYDEHFNSKNKTEDNVIYLYLVAELELLLQLKATMKISIIIF